MSGIALQRINNHWISRDLAFRRITFPSVIVSFSLVPLLSSCFEHNLSYSLVKCLAECDSCFVCRNGLFVYSLFVQRLPLLYLVRRLDRERHRCPAELRACAPPRVVTVLLRILPQPLCVCISISVSATCCLSCVFLAVSVCNKLCSKYPNLKVCSFRDRILMADATDFCGTFNHQQ